MRLRNKRPELSVVEHAAPTSFEIRPGIDGRNGRDGRNGKDGLSGKDGAAGKTGLRGSKGSKGDSGTDGLDGWSPILAVISDGERRVHQVVGWTGGTGEPPESGWYIGPAGPVTRISDATDLRGPQGTPGINGGVIVRPDSGAGRKEIFVLANPSDPSPTTGYAALVFRPTGVPDTYTMELVQ